MVSTINILVFTDNMEYYKGEANLSFCNTYIKGSIEDVIYVIQNDNISLIIIDLATSFSSYTNLCSELRNICDLPIIVVAAAENYNQIFTLLDFGADYIIPKTMGNKILIMQINSALRRIEADNKIPIRSIATNHEQNMLKSQLESVIEVTYVVYSFSIWKLNTNSRRLLADDGREVLLTNNEYRLLHLLLNMPKSICTRRYIMDKMHIDLDTFDRAIDIIICRLRSKLENDPKKPDIIKTIRGSGYMLDSRVTKSQLTSE